MRNLLLATAILLSSVVTTGYTQAQSYEDSIGMHGVALPLRQVLVRSTIPGKIDTIPVHEGQFVKKGDVLVHLDAAESLAKQKIAELEANSLGVLKNANIELKYAESNFNRIAKLFGNQAMNEKEYEDAKLMLQRAQAAIEIEKERLAIAKARYALATAELSNFSIRAPFDGYVSQMKVNEGQAVTETEDLLEIVSLDKLRVELFLPVEWQKSIAVGSKQKLNIGHPFNQQVPATVTYQSKTIESTSGTLRFVFEIDNRELQLPAGFGATLNRPTKQFVSKQE